MKRSPTLRSYPSNSPEAAARIVALVLISDGHVCRSEIEVLQQLQADQALGLQPGAFARVVHTLCEDMLREAHERGARVCSVDGPTLAGLLAEVDEPDLQDTVLRLAGAAALADRQLVEAEAMVVAAAHQHWRRGGQGPATRSPGAALLPA
jgi:hypothetical protein